MCPLPRHLIASAALLLSLSAVHAAPTSSRPADGAAGDGQRATRAATQQLAPGQTPQGLSGGEWAGIQKQIEAARYKVTPSDDAQAPWRAVNHALGITAQFGADGATRVQVSGSEQARAADSASLRLTGVGYRQLTPVGAAPERVAEGGQLTYRWSQQLTEWWVNQPGKLEQWFRIEQRPAQASGPLRLAMRLETELKPVMAGPQLQLKDRHGATRLHYDRLKVWDAQGTELPARMQLAGRTLTLAIDDAKAQYPLTIDPSWGQQAYLKASNTAIFQYFGSAVALSGDTLAVGAYGEASKATGVNGDQSDYSAADSGAVYVFTRSGGTWSQQAYLKASNTGKSDKFGSALALSGDTLAVGAYLEDSKAIGVNGNQANNTAADSGAVYVFTRSAGTWSQQAYLKASNTSAEDRFGAALALSGDTLAVGAPYEDSKATGVNGDQADNSAGYAGAVYVFTRSAGTWSQQAYLKASNTGAGDSFGSALALSGDTLAVGAGLEDSKATGVNGDQSDNSAFNAGAVYVFTRSGSTWSQQAYLKASNTSAEDRFGAALALSGDTLAVGAHWEDSKATGVNGDQSDNSKFRAGAVYVFKLTHTVSPSVSAAGGGTLTPATPQAVFNGQTTSFTLAPEAGHIIDSVGGTCGGTLAGSTYTTEDIYTDCTVIVTFARTVNGACGSAHGLPSMSAPAANLCSAGTTSTVTGSGPWEWTCQGSNGGSTARCSAPVFTPVTHFEGPSATGTATVKVDLNGGGPFCGFTGTPAMIAAAPGASPARPPGIVFPHGLFEFTASHCTPGSTITLTMQLPSALPAAAKYYKWGPEPGNPTAHWYVLPATIAGTTVTFSITDGAQGDDDLDASNGTIVDQGGPGVPDSGAAVTPVPTLGEWSLMLLGMLAAGMGARRLRARP